MAEISRSGERFNIVDASMSALSRPGASTVFIDVGSRKISSNVTRDGLPVGVWTMNPEVLDAIVTARPSLRVRVVSQSIPPGTPVPQGTSVNLVMAPANGLPVGVVAGTHADMREALIADGYRQLVEGKSNVRAIIARAAGGNLVAEDETTVRGVFAEAGIDVTDEPGRDVAAAVETLRVLADFGR